MTVLALLLQIATPTPTHAPGSVLADVPRDVVVIGERLKRWSGIISSNPLGTHCRTTQSTGNEQVDAIGCRAFSICWPDARRRIKDIRDKRRDPADRARIKTEAEAAFTACTQTQRTLFIAQLVASGTVREGRYQ